MSQKQKILLFNVPRIIDLDHLPIFLFVIESIIYSSIVFYTTNLSKILLFYKKILKNKKALQQNLKDCNLLINGGA